MLIAVAAVALAITLATDKKLSAALSKAYSEQNNKSTNSYEFGSEYEIDGTSSGVGTVKPGLASNATKTSVKSDPAKGKSERIR